MLVNAAAFVVNSVEETQNKNNRKQQVW